MNSSSNKIYNNIELDNLLVEVEDYLLEMRGIKILPTKLDLIKQELLNNKFTEQQFLLCIKWIKYGKWPNNKKEIDLSDFYPDEKSIENLKSHFVSKEYHYKVIQSLKNEFLIEKSKIIKETENKYISQEQINDQIQFMKVLIDSEKTIIDLKDEKNKLKKKISQLETTNEKLKLAIVSFENQLIKDVNTDILKNND